MNYEQFLADLSAAGFSPQTVKAYREDLKLFAAYLQRERTRLDRVSPMTIQGFVAALHETGVGELTIRRRLAAVSSYFEYLRSTGMKIANPTRGRLRRRRTPRRLEDLQGKAVPEETLDALISGITVARDRALLLLLLSSGLRVAEVHQLQIESIEEVEDPQPDGTLKLVGGTGTVMGKGAKPRRFYFDTTTAEAIAAYLSSRQDSNRALFISERGTRLSIRAIQYTVGEWCRKLNLPHINVHALRHSFATRLANAQIDSRVLQAIMGHAHFNTTTKYFRLTDQTTSREYNAAMEFVSRQ
jgi:site-specific recombinase XerC